MRSLSGLLLFALVVFSLSDINAAFEAETVSFHVKAQDIETNLRIMSFFILPNKELTFDVTTKKESCQYTIVFDGKPIDKDTPYRWKIVAPSMPGCYVMTVNCPQKTEMMTVNIFVLVPFKQVKKGYLNGYRIGQYPTEIFKQLPVYKPPKGFIEITTDNQDLLLSPHFRLNQFLCKQQSGYPKYIVLREILLLKLELVLQKVNEHDIPCETFHIMSGYRTPFYNHAIGNVKYSRHQWGDAVDIFIDENPADDMIDDLNKDGVHNWKDAAIIYDIIDGMYGKKFYEKFVGGLGRYRKTPNHGPFVHLDARGYRARWGD